MLKKAFVAAALMSTFAFNTAHAADGQINFTGRILASTCDIAPGDVNQTVALGAHAIDAFKGAGSQVGDTSFSFNLSGCDASINGARVIFEGTRDDDNSDLLKVSAAQGVGIGIYEADGTTLVNLGQSSALQPITSNAGVLAFVAKYVSTAASVTAGEANATADFTIQYP